jgi:starvation-inducible DNA-binding protein
MANATSAPTFLGSPALIAALHRRQANALVMYLNYKKYHWNTYGPHFRDLHLLFDEHATATLAELDEFAERTLMIEGKPLSDPSAYLPLATVPLSSGEKSARAAVEEAVEGETRVIAEMHADAEEATKQGDIGTADLYTRLVQVHQKQRWFLSEILKRNDGLGV